MKRETKLAVLKELIINSHDLCYSVYTPDLQLISSSWDEDRTEGMDLLLAGVGEEMLAYSKNGHYPYLWIPFSTLPGLQILSGKMTCSFGSMCSARR